ncbi:MAG: 30S ribosomal protein S21 [Gemmatimonadaceae bacterium]
MPEIHLTETDGIDWALKVFKRRMQQSGILRELRQRRHHVKPSDARRLKSKAAQRTRDKAKRKLPR